jgi:3-phenylpropionate/trans-cinnamate dioxygenase ferredoxin component
LARYKVARTEEIPADSLKRVIVEGEPICLAHAEDGGFYAIGDVCTHEEYSLSDGELWGMDVECPVHGSRFSLTTGAVTGLPAVIPAKTYPVEIEGEDILIEL